MAECTPSDDQVRGRYCDGTYHQTGHTTEGDDFDAWLARVRRDAALHEKQRIAGEVRLWGSVNRKMGEGREASRLYAVADDIDRIPEETP